MITITSGGPGRLVVHGPFRDDGVFQYLRQALESARYVKLPYPGFTVPATRHNAEAIDGAPCRVEWQCERPCPPATRRLEGEDIPTKTQPYAHQREDLARSALMPAFAFIWEMGTGKTKVGIDTAAVLWTKGLIDGVLILAPKGVHAQWVNEQLPVHCGVDYAAHAVTLANFGKRAEAALTRDVADLKRLVFLAMNTDAVNSKRGAAIAERFLRARRCLFLLDESHYIKTPGASRTQEVTALGKLAPYRRIMTGTPISRGTEDLFAQYRFLDPNIIGMSTFTAFTTAYCVRNEHREIVGYKQINQLRQLLAPYTSRRKKADCLDLPPKVYARRPVDLSEEQTRWYKEVQAALKDAAAENKLDVKGAMDGLLRLRQIVGGFLPDGTALSNPRLAEVEDILYQTEGRAVVWATHTAEIKALAERIARGRPVRTYYGDTTDAARAEAIAYWRETDGAVLVANPGAGGTGLNLDGATTVVYYTHTFNAVHRWQSEDRTHRATTRHTVTYFDLVASGTVDVAILANLRRKASVSEMTLGELRQLILGL